MKQYVIDELRPADYQTIKSYLDEHLDRCRIEGLYWVPIDSKMFSDVQTAHADCQPFYFALNLEPTHLACELLVRTQKRVRCSCIAYATESQRSWMMQYVDAIFEKFDIKT